MEKFRNKYKSGSTRLSGYDYHRQGIYFITVVAKNREHYFGEIKEGEFYPNELGIVVKREWLKTPEIRPEMNINLDEFCVMPNHFHGLVEIGENIYNHNSQEGNQFGPQLNNLPSIIRGFKSAVTIFARNNNILFDWQNRYHDHIVRNDSDLERIRSYILNNPAKWDEDDLF
ncbi:MAG: hypothetical protein CVU14_05160 [Bacteroidetes bacterium HGW-Bacteroidetes-9]|jgi:REP element-mobilizing transposase RayT|nr:MAG: hypothetical protein CVU14_05160 [Bacteroidetes bacterium HGW-Bacteroidetes-9]